MSNAHTRFRPRTRLGERLHDKGLVTADALKAALEQQQRSGGRLGNILTHRGDVSTLTMYRQLATQHGLPFANLLTHPPDMSLLKAQQVACYLHYQILPIRREEGVLILATANPGHHTDIAGRLYPGEAIQWEVTSPRDIVWTIQRRFGRQLVHAASESLYHSTPHYALHRPQSRETPLWLQSMALGLAILFAVILVPETLMHLVLLVSSLFFLATLIFKLVLVCVGKSCRGKVYDLTNLPLPSDEELPVYTILVPLFHEADSVPGMLASLSAIDYPPHKLDIQLIVEENDKETPAAIRRAHPGERFHIVTVPKSTPQTKPKACNYAMYFSRGEFVAIYDAEDAPDAMQLRRAVATFRRYPNVSCLQARLNYYNYHENWLTRLFSIEYTTLFDYMIPALYALNIPIPLGGTSNHIRRSALDEVGAWDAYNVTEDADLGIRLASEGHITLPLPSLTQEEATMSAVAWIKQRTRWIKGYLQTWGVLSRNTIARYRHFGARGFWGIHFFIGAASLAYVISPLLWCASMLWLLWPTATIPLSPMVTFLCIWVLITGVLVQWICAYIVTRHSERKPGMLAILGYPLYFTLHAVAGLRAFWQLLTNPHYWEKTRHGVSRVLRPGLTDVQ